jgi:hypothetical protein
MLKRILAVIIVSCFLPVMAHAASWSLTAAAKSAGGAVQVGTVTKTQFQGSIMVSYPTETPVTVTVLPTAGYVISKMVINGATLLNPTVTTFTVNGPTSQIVHAYFTAATASFLSINASVAGGIGGSVNPAGITGLTANAQLGSAKVVTFTPNSAYFAVNSISGIPAGTTTSPALPAALGTAVTVTFPPTYVMPSNINLIGTFTSSYPVANAGSSQTGYTGDSITLSGSGSQAGSGISSYLWAQTSGPAPVTLTPNSNSALVAASFTPSVVGTYTFSLTLQPGGSTASATVTVNADANLQVLTSCQNCHASQGIVKGTDAYNKWTSSKHLVNKVVCADCHSAGSHPYSVSVNVCINCHINSLGASPAIALGHNDITDFNKTTCTSCHNPHAAAAVPPGQPHFSNSSSVGNSASYKTSQSACADCHISTAANQTIRQEWKSAGHADINSPAWMSQDFKTLDTCVRCHTTTGFIAYSTAKVTAAWGISTDKTKEVLRCDGCHSDVANGVVRTVSANKPFASEPTFTNHNVGASNVCMNCHGGTDNGNFIQSKVGTANFANLAFQYNAHNMTAGGSLQGKTGFNFAGRTYANFSGNSHSKIGMTNSMGTGTVGPCVACHMSATNKHTFNAVSSASGSIAKINTTVCNNCHNSSLPAATLDAKRVAFNTALEILRIQLADKGYTWNSATATFNDGAASNWGATNQAGANVMGAAHNYKLFITEPGAYTHNPAYAKQLITDSIDAVFHNGTVTGDISTALSDLYGKGKITADQVNSINTYKLANSSCNSCHGNPPTLTSTGATHTSSSDCNACHTFTGVAGVTHNNGTLDVSMTCASCHGNPPSTQSIHITGFAKYNHDKAGVTHSNCAQCHSTPPTYATTATHRDGIVEVLSNSTACSSCHGYPPATIIATGAAHVNDTNCANCHDYTTFTASTHNNGTVNFKTGTAACSSCHGYPPTTQTIHANGVVKYNHDKAAVDYTNCAQCHSTPVAPTVTTTHLNTRVDLLTNANACTSCHGAPPATTAHTSATLTPFNCTNCHTYTESSAATHNNGAIDFSISLTCDTCHGYPPLPLAQLNARSGGAYANAKVEDYTGGGGHHATHLLSTISANEGFAPCLPCHPGVDINFHGQGGGTVLRSNINVFYAADTGYVFDETRTKRYDVLTQTCSNVSCHFQPTVSW